MATLNETADTYAVGMILYQLYNDGSLPFKGKAPDEALLSRQCRLRDRGDHHEGH